jgi:hypothetical protein
MQGWLRESWPGVHGWQCPNAFRAHPPQQKSDRVEQRKSMLGFGLCESRTAAILPSALTRYIVDQSLAHLLVPPAHKQPSREDLRTAAAPGNASRARQSKRAACSYVLAGSTRTRVLRPERPSVRCRCSGDAPTQPLDAPERRTNRPDPGA